VFPAIAWNIESIAPIQNFPPPISLYHRKNIIGDNISL
jgi:hypothetical protein